MKQRLQVVFVALLASGCESQSPADPLSGGATTVYDATANAYANDAANITADDFPLFNLGHTIFDQNWVTAPATTSDMDGLGPLFNQRSCSSCHSHDGRSAPFAPNGQLLGMLFRLSQPGADPHGGPMPDPVYGTQLRPDSILTVPVEGTPHVAYTEVPGTYGDGTAYSLQAPAYSIDAWGYGTPASTLAISARVGNAVFGLGLLGAIPESAILANVRHDDPDGVVGTPNYVWSVEDGASVLGRFGWKANQPTVRQQTAAALVGDIGITSSMFHDKTCTPSMTACNAANTGGSPDISDADLDALVLYMNTLAVPARRSVDDSTALRGERLFGDMGCASCHVATYRTGTLAGVVEVTDQTIHPYTDLLLHDLGDGLADHRADYVADGRQWRTTPLWGIGLLQKVNGHDLLLHDGRARGLAEAILWHGGEAQAARERFRLADADDRAALLTFLGSL